jgi:hypothetical protein
MDIRCGQTGHCGWRVSVLFGASTSRGILFVQEISHGFARLCPFAFALPLFGVNLQAA